MGKKKDKEGRRRAAEKAKEVSARVEETEVKKAKKRKIREVESEMVVDDEGAAKPKTPEPWVIT